MSSNHCAAISISLLAPTVIAWVGSMRYYSKLKQQGLATLSPEGRTPLNLIESILEYTQISPFKLKVMPGKGLKACFKYAKNTVELTSDLLESASLTSVTIATHEYGHVWQHNQGYRLGLANLWMTFWGISIQISLFFVLGFISKVEFSSSLLSRIVAYFVIVLIVAGIPLSIYNCWIEYDASRKALLLMKQLELVEKERLGQARAILRGSLMDYITGTICCWLISITLLAEAFC